MIYFGLDLGTNSLGISINNELNIVFGVENYNFSKGNYKKARTHLLQLMKKRNVYNLVIGLPLQLDGSEGERANSVRRFISDLKKEADFEFDVCFFDERYSTIEAEEELRKMGFTASEISKKIDMTSAIIVLEKFLIQAKKEKNDGK